LTDLPDENKVPLAAPNVEHATNNGISHDITPSVLFPQVWVSKNIYLNQNSE